MLLNPNNTLRIVRAHSHKARMCGCHCCLQAIAAGSSYRPLSQVAFDGPAVRGRPLCYYSMLPLKLPWLNPGFVDYYHYNLRPGSWNFFIEIKNVQYMKTKTITRYAFLKPKTTFCPPLFDSVSRSRGPSLRPQMVKSYHIPVKPTITV